MKELINFCFKDGENNFISVIKFDATGTGNKSKFKMIFDRAFLKLAINFLLNNISFSFGNLPFQQITGTPMGFDAAPCMSDLFLYCYEDKWLSDTTKEIYIKHAFLVIHFSLQIICVP